MKTKKQINSSGTKVHTKDAIKKRGEIFTPTKLVNEMLDKLPQEVLLNPQKTVGDIAGCGNGQFLVEVLRRRLEAGIPHREALSTIYGVEIDADNANQCRQRLLMGSVDPELISIVNRNIICADSLNPLHPGWKSVGYMWSSASPII